MNEMPVKTNGIIKIDKSIIPIPAGKFGQPRKYPFSELSVNQSFLVPGMKATSGISGSIGQARRTLKRDFVSRKVDGGVRVWRTK